MAYSKEFRDVVINKVLSGEKVSTVSKDYGVTVVTIYNWLKKLSVSNGISIDNCLVNSEEFDYKSIDFFINRINNLIDTNELEQALDLCNAKKEIDNVDIQSQKIRILLLMFERLKDKVLLIEALNICRKYNGNKIIDDQELVIEKLLINEANEMDEKKSQNTIKRIRSLMDSKMFLEVLNLCNNTDNLDELTMDFQKVRILLLKYSEVNNRVYLIEALNICRKYTENETFNIQRKKIQELLDKCNNKNFNLAILDKIKEVKFLISNNKLNEALEICNSLSDFGNAIIDSQKVKILLLMFSRKREERFLIEALKVCLQYDGNEIFDKQKYKIDLIISKEDKVIKFKEKSHRIKFLTEKRRYSEALALCNEPEFFDETAIDSQKVKILLLMFKEENNKDILNEALSICEKYDKENCLNVQARKIKRLIKKYDKEFNLFIYDKSHQIKLLMEDNRLVEALELCNSLGDSNNVVIDSQRVKILLAMYSENGNKQLLKQALDICDIHDGNITFDSPREKIAAINRADSLLIKESITKSKTSSKNIISCEGVRVSSRYNSVGDCTSKKKDISKTCKNEILIKDLFPKEVLSIGTNLYLKMRNYETRQLAIDAWDRFDYLIHKSSSDKDALISMINLLRKLESIDSLEINVDDKKVNRLLIKQVNQ